MSELEELEKRLTVDVNPCWGSISMYVEISDLHDIIQENIRLRAKVTELQETGTRLLNLLRDKKL